MTQHEDVTNLVQEDHSQQATPANLPTEAQIREHGVFHYSRAVSDEVYFRSKFNAMRGCLAHAFPDRPLGGVTFGAEDTPVGRFLDEYAEHLLRACGNPAYWGNGEMSDLLFEWEETIPMICRYLTRRGTPIETLRKLTIEDAKQIDGLRDVFRTLLDSDNGNESGANIAVHGKITVIHEQHGGPTSDIKAQCDRIESKIDNLEAQSNRIEAQGNRMEKTTIEIGHGVALLVQNDPNAKRTPIISWAEAAEIFMPGIFTKKGDSFVRTKDERRKAIDSFRRNCSNWIKAGFAGRSKLHISRDNLATTNIWRQWVEAYTIAERKATIVSEHAGKIETEKTRRRNPTE